MVYCIEESFQVKVYAVMIPIVCIFLHPLQRIVGAAVWAEAKTVVIELSFVYRYQHLAYSLLDEPVNNRRDTELT